MQKLTKQITSDGIKLRRTPFFVLHIIIPIIGICAFSLYQSTSIYDPNKFAINYFQVLTLVYPLIAAWICSIVTEQEIEAGGGFFLLSTPSRSKILFSKLFYLLLFGIVACFLATFGFHGIMMLIEPKFSLLISTTLLMTLLIGGCSIFEYLFHTWLGLRFSRNVSFAFASAEILLAALMLTGLGNGIWFFIPSAWGVRMINLLAKYLTQGTITILSTIQFSIVTAIIVTLLMSAFLFLWFRRWDGRKQTE